MDHVPHRRRPESVPAVHLRARHRDLAARLVPHGVEGGGLGFVAPAWPSSNGVSSGTLAESPTAVRGRDRPRTARGPSRSRRCGASPIATAALSAVNERNLRRKRADMAALTNDRGRAGRLRFSRRDAGHPPGRPPRCVRDRPEPRARFARGRPRAPRVERHERRTHSRPGWTASSSGRLPRVPPSSSAGSTPSSIRASPALIPDARNLLIVPLFLAGGFRLGVLVVEGVGSRRRDPRVDGRDRPAVRLPCRRASAQRVVARRQPAQARGDPATEGRADGAEPLAGVDGDRTHRRARPATRRTARVGRRTRTVVVAPAERAGGRAASDRGGHPRRSAPAAGRRHDAPGSLPA